MLIAISVAAEEPRLALAEIEAALATSRGEQRQDLLIRAAEQHELPAARRVDFALEAIGQLAETGTATEVRLRLALAQAYTTLSAPEEAERQSRSVIDLATALGDEAGRAQGHLQLGHVAYWASDFESTLELATTAFSIFQTIDDAKGSGEASWLQGAAHGSLGSHARAIEAYLRTVELYEEAGYERGIPLPLYSIAVRYFFLGRLDEATRLAERALDGARSTGQERLDLMCIQLLGNIAREQGQIATALDYLRAALVAQRRLDPDDRNTAEILQNLGDTHIARGSLQLAERHHREALEIFEAGGTRIEIASVLLSLGRIDTLRGHHDAAIGTLGQALELGAEVGSKPKQAEILQQLSATYAEAGRFREALDAFQRHEALERQVVNEVSEREINEMQTRLEDTLKEQQIERLEREKALAAVELERQQTTRAALIGGFVALLVILLLVFNRYRLTSRAKLMRQAIRQQRKVSQQLREIDELKDEFLANTSHQLRTPLYGMVGLLETVLDSPSKLPTDAETALGEVLESGQRLTKMVDDILDFSKLRRQALDLNLESIEMHALTDIVLTLAKPVADMQEVSLHNRVSPDLPAARADQIRTQQIVHNLVVHCARFAGQGQIDVTAEVSGGRLITRVACLGNPLGRPSGETLAAQFIGQPSADGSASLSLDLAMSRWLVEVHGGELELEPWAAGGVAAAFSLPIADIDSSSREPIDALVDTDTDADAPIATAVASIADADGKIDTLLLVDDEPVVRLVLHHHLADAGYRLLSATNGPEALTILDREPVDLVLLDVMMPRMSGYAVCRAIRKTRSRNQLPVLFLSAKSHTDDRVAGFDVGGNDYLVKPIARDELLARVGTHLEALHSLRRQARETETLRGLLPICSSCKKIRDDGGYWKQVEVYISQHSEAEFSHGICPDCAAEMFCTLDHDRS